MKSFGVAAQNFCVTREEKTSGLDTEIVYKARDSSATGPEVWLGYIYFKARDGNGTIEITNRSATLQPWHLDLGGTSKTGDEHQAGAHGEGLKVALLKFNFTTRGRLVARLNRMLPSSIQKAKDRAQSQTVRTLLPFAADPNEDVQFVIGEGNQGRDELGELIRRSPVRREVFDGWTKAALFLNDSHDGTIISTEVGDLINNAQFCGNIYLKGLLLNESTPGRSASITNQPLKFGYNFASGKTNRERQSVTNAAEEARAILAIWSRVLVVRPDLVQDLSGMLNTREPDYADVMGAKRFLDRATALCLKNYLLGTQFAGRWYYCSEDKSKNPRLGHIIHGLGCEGVELTQTYWGILHNHALIHTAEEEERRRFTTAPPVVSPQTTFAVSLCRLPRACIRACPKTDGMALSFIQAGQLHLQLFFSESEGLFRIHERWLSPHGAIQELGPSDGLVEADIIFHTVKSLFAEAIEQLPFEIFLEEDDARTVEWRRKLEVNRAEQHLLNYLRIGNLSIDKALDRPSFGLRWTIDARWNADTEVEIQCHRASRCSQLRDTLLIAKDACPDNMPCITDPEPMSQEVQDEVLVPRPHTCRRSRT
ncbi:hypothetical protein AK830_g7545 [Neonectria ditissima]|uniref:Uncharacterized protein n=1 Tax=Neonectria ditissima TaxID=78410 RepID=A0A0P7BF22_9HYPO|nr:hypothetical protein AK830_g7545 [Neonectria ditissima]